jgi:drug/metabolite transporter (DMT)-like permease
MYVDIAFAIYYILINVLAAFVFTYIKQDTLPYYYGILINLLFTIGSVALLKFSDLSLIKQSALITLCARFGYLSGLVWIGEIISPMQWVGLAIMTVGALLTNR